MAKVVTEKRFNSITQTEITEVYILVDGTKEYFGESANQAKVYDLIADANELAKTL